MIVRNRLPVLLLSGIALLALAAFQAAALGAGETVSVREVRGFDGVSFNTSGQLIIRQGGQEGLEIVGRAEELADLVAEVRGGKLVIGREGAGPLLSLRPPVFRLTVKRISALETHSSGRISAEDLRADSLRVQLSSSGGITLASLAADSLEVRISSSGSLMVSGRVDSQDVLLSSSGSYQARDLDSRKANVRVSSSGTATLRASDSLQANVTSSGDVRYYGNPLVSANVTSSGRLVRLGD